MGRGKLFWSILKRTNADKVVTGFIVYFFVTALGIMLVEPGITTYGDAVWYSFSIITSIGFGDLVAVTTMGRVLSIIVGIYGLIVLAFIPGIITSYYMEIVKVKMNESMEMTLYQLEHLEQLSKEELKEVSQKVKKWRKHS